MPTKNNLLSPAARAILKATLIAGTLDILSALFWFGVVFAKVSPRRILQGIASAVLGKKAFDGGMATELLGLLIHYCITLAFACFFFVIFPFVPFLRKNKICSGILYGIFVFIVMNIVVLPLTGFRPFRFRWEGVLENTIILMYAIGIPISFIIHRYYSERNSR